MTCPVEISARLFVPRGVLERLAYAPDLVRQGKHVAEVAVLFVDVQGCSVLCEELPPPAMNRLLEGAFGEFFDCVQDAGGDVNEIMGDGFMALFEERPLQQSVRAAAHAALAIQQHAVACRTAADLLEVPFVVNMGLHAGRAFVGVTRTIDATKGTLAKARRVEDANLSGTPPAWVAGSGMSSLACRPILKTWGLAIPWSRR